MTSAARRPALRPTARTERRDFRVASPKAEAFWTSLRTDLADLISELAALGEATAITAPADADPLPADQASREIDEMLTDVRVLRAQLREARALARESARAGQGAATAAATLEADRLYERDGEVYRTVLSGAGKLYAKIWTGDGWEYAAGAIRSLRPQHRMTVERAKELSVRFARCIRCARVLTADQSVEQGIGPVCITKI